MIEPTMYELAVTVVSSEINRDKMQQCKGLIEQMIRSDDPAARAVAILASATLDAVVHAMADDEE